MQSVTFCCGGNAKLVVSFTGQSMENKARGESSQFNFPNYKGDYLNHGSLNNFQIFTMREGNENQTNRILNF